MHFSVTGIEISLTARKKKANGNREMFSPSPAEIQGDRHPKTVSCSSQKDHALERRLFHGG